MKVGEEYPVRVKLRNVLAVDFVCDDELVLPRILKRVSRLDEEVDGAYVECIDLNFNEFGVHVTVYLDALTVNGFAGVPEQIKSMFAEEFQENS